MRQERDVYTCQQLNPQWVGGPTQQTLQNVQFDGQTLAFTMTIEFGDDQGPEKVTGRVGMQLRNGNLVMVPQDQGQVKGGPYIYRKVQ
jgi:hypothetical protein